MLGNDWVTPPRASVKQCALERSQSAAEAPPAGGSAERLEDVEKFVRNARARLDEHEVFVLDMVDRLLTRIERLEAALGDPERW